MADDDSFEEKEMGNLIDASTGGALSVTVPVENVSKTNEVLTMVTGGDVLFGRDFGRAFRGRAGLRERQLALKNDVTIFGRMPQGGDYSEFDALPGRYVDMSPETNPGLYADEYEYGKGDPQVDVDWVEGDGDESPAVFESPEPEAFPVFKSALKHFEKAEAKPRVVRIDTDSTYGDFVCERAVKEIARRLGELRGALEEHLAEHEHEEHPGLHLHPKELRKWDEIIGAAKAVSKIKSSKDATEAADAMPQIPVDVPPSAQGKVKCWKDGDNVICSMRFQSADGKVKIATMAAKPKTDTSEVAGWALRSGVDPITILGVLPDLADVACGKRLVRDVAGAALKAQRRLDVCGMGDGDEPVILASEGDEASSAALAALMHTEQRADAGDPQAQAEMDTIRKAAATPSGQKIAAPLLAESTARLAAGRAKKMGETSFMARYAQMGLCL